MLKVGSQENYQKEVDARIRAIRKRGIRKISFSIFYQIIVKLFVVALLVYFCPLPDLIKAAIIVYVGILICNNPFALLVAITAHPNLICPRCGGYQQPVTLSFEFASDKYFGGSWWEEFFHYTAKCRECEAKWKVVFSQDEKTFLWDFYEADEFV